jgi:eukaryotic-like serine/threonine-protein kinase
MEGSNDDPWGVIDALFAAALELPEAERQAFLDAEAPNPQVRARVERLLRAEVDSRGLLDERAAVQRALIDALFDDLASGDLPPPSSGSERIGERVGPYELVELVGHGGMATVYFARRVEGGFEQRVAVKLIRTDADTTDLVRRFESERDILSALRHPNIARLLDGGSTAAGMPYLVMDPVEGIPITDRVRQDGADVASRLRLFLEVAGAVAYAHRNLVVHRDLKPSNILVGEDGRPMLLDFGIAKLLSEGGTDSGVTQTRARWLTPGYASPEQIRGEAVTTATDVYQLGVLLHELLAQRRPFEADGLSTYQLERMICEEDPPRPSSVAPPADRRALEGDLDAIVLKAMRKEPEARYASVEAMADDIRRHLAARPVEAHRGGRAYRARKFARRYRGGVAAAAVLVLLLLTWAVTATAQGARLAAERDRAEAESAKATQVTAFLTSLLQAENPREAQGSEPTVRQVLERGVQRIGQELADQPDVQATLYLATGDVFEALGDFDAADSLLVRAVEVRSEIHGAGPHEELAEAQAMLGRLRLDQARLEEAEDLMESALAQRRALYPEGSEAIADDLVELGEVKRVLGQPGEALALYRDALAMYEALEAPPMASVGIARNNIALVHHQAGRLAEALPLYEQAVVELRDTLGANHPYTLILEHNLAGFNRSLGRFATADSIFEGVVPANSK